MTRPAPDEPEGYGDAEIARIQRGFWAAVLGTLWTCIELGILFLGALLSIGHR